ncbi:MAG TPA: ABC transporter ATP-binding protein, partial [Chryseosolibacter sp.]|nr:ABC transporter ATP-binding protein [Chryseosolibacter sp.]
LRQHYSRILNHASRTKEAQIEQLTANAEQEQIYKNAHDRYVNGAVSDAVRNLNSSDRIVEYDGQLVQKVFPIYMDEHRPSHIFDFSANLYQPTKHFLGAHIDTLYFNLAVIWSMTIVLFITLYFDLLKKLVTLLEGNRKYRRKDRH